MVGEVRWTGMAGEPTSGATSSRDTSAGGPLRSCSGLPECFESLDDRCKIVLLAAGTLKGVDRLARLESTIPEPLRPVPRDFARPAPVGRRRPRDSQQLPESRPTHRPQRQREPCDRA